MISNNFHSIVKYPFDNGMTVFVSGFLFTLSLYHIMLYFQHKDKSYLLYSFYTGLIFYYISQLGHNFFVEFIFRPYKTFYYIFNPGIQWLFNTVYFIFVITFINLQEKRPRFYYFLKWIIGLYLFVLVVLTGITYFMGKGKYLLDGYAYFFLPTVTPLAIYTMWVLYRMETVLKHYILLGSFIYLSLSLVAFYAAFNGHEAIYLFYLAVLIESIFFALGLGAKQRLLMWEKNRMQELAISGHKKNIELQNIIKEKMDSEIVLKTKEIENLMKEKKEKEKSTIEAEYSRKTLDLRLRALQTQMNPHFLFNALNSIKHYIIANKKEDASLYLSKLSYLIRTILDNSQVRTISLNEELNTMQLYVEVENLRLTNPIHLEIVIQGNINNIKIPPLILQPFIENAIWHGLALKKSDKRIRIKVNPGKEHLMISIEDNGIGRDRAAVIRAAKRSERKSLGIALTKERLQAFCIRALTEPVIQYVDLYKKDKPAGTRVEIKIPMSCFK